MSILAGLFLFSFVAAPDPVTVVGQVTVRQRVIIRVPRVPAGAAMPTSLRPTSSAPPRPIVWQEKSGPRCVPIEQLAGALLGQRDSVDLVLAGGKRMRARLDDDCPALDFYRGFYIKPHRDGMICADRDQIRSRAGGECRIDSFRRLEPKR